VPAYQEGRFGYMKESTFSVAGITSRTQLEPEQYKEIKLGETEQLLKLLQPYESLGWKFVNAKPDNDLSGTLKVLDYLAIGGYSPQVGAYLVGAGLNLQYVPPDINNDTGKNKRRWIQWVKTNHPIDPIVGDIHLKEGQNSRIDVPAGSVTPFYDDYFRQSANAYFFQDTPGRGDFNENHDWLAEVFLAELSDPNNSTTPQEVTIYKGIRWGWKNRVTRPKTSKKFSDSLASGLEVDRFNLSDLTPGSKYIAWTNNDLPSNRCNPNTFLSTDNDSGFRLGFDDNSSPVGNGFASALTGTVGSSGNINLNVRAAGGGARGQDRGNYELFVDVYDPQESPDFSVATSGGGGFGKEMRGLTQQNPILPNSIQNGWQVFNKVPGCRWYDPPTTYGFEFQSLEDTLFTEILDFPAGEDQEFTVAVGDSILGNFSPGDKLDFVSLLGYPVDNFRITGIDSLFGPTAETAFPIQLAFQEREGSFKMRQISKPIDAEAVPEPGSILAAKGMLLWFAAMRHILRKKRQAG
jgi:hypothetical protein